MFITREEMVAASDNVKRLRGATSILLEVIKTAKHVAVIEKAGHCLVSIRCAEVILMDLLEHGGYQAKLLCEELRQKCPRDTE